MNPLRLKTEALVLIKPEKMLDEVHELVHLRAQLPTLLPPFMGNVQSIVKKEEAGLVVKSEPMAKRKAVGDIFSSDSSEDEEGQLSEISGNDDLNDDEKQRLAQMTEIEREEELFKRAEKQEAIRAREAVRKKLKENKSAGVKSLSKVFSSDSSSGDESGPDFAPQPASRKEALKKKNQRLASQLNAQVAKRQQLKAKEELQRRMHVADVFASDDEAGSDAEKRTARGATAGITGAQRKIGNTLLSSSSSSGSEEDYSTSSLSSNGARDTNTASEHKRKKLLSLAERKRSSRKLNTSEGDANAGRSSDDEPGSKEITQLSDISKIQLSRTYLEKWVHMPFFDRVVSGCFVRVNIGSNPETGAPVYRCAQVIDVVESTKIYDLGSTRTNKALKLRIGQSERVFRLPFMSNAPITLEEFNSFYRRSKEEGAPIPTVDRVNQKREDIREAFDYRVQDNKALEAILQSKRRFQARPSNYAVRKAELTKQIEVAESSHDLETMRRIEEELKELEEAAERLDRRRSADIKKINFINQRNRRMNQDLAEEAARLEEEESAKLFEAEGGDPFNRLATRPTLLNKELREQLAKRKSGAGTDAPAVSYFTQKQNTGLADKLKSSAQSALPSHSLGSGTSKSAEQPNQHSLHGIHDFDVGIELGLDQGSTTADTVHDSSALHMSMHDRRMDTAQGVFGGAAQRRSLNLEEYKKKKGLI